MYIDCGPIRLEAYDYGQKILLGPEVADAVGVPEGTPEYHQCVLLGSEAAKLMEGGAPGMGAVREAASRARKLFWEQAAAAREALGEEPPFMSEAEADLRASTHDALNLRHDRDVRCVDYFSRDEVSPPTWDPNITWWIIQTHAGGLDLRVYHLDGRLYLLYLLYL